MVSENLQRSSVLLDMRKPEEAANFLALQIARMWSDCQAFMLKASSSTVEISMNGLIKLSVTLTAQRYPSLPTGETAESGSPSFD